MQIAVATCLPAPVGSPSLRQSLCPLVHWKPKESLWLVRPCAVRFWNFAANAKEFLSPQQKAGFREHVDSCDPLLPLLRYKMQVNTRRTKLGAVAVGCDSKNLSVRAVEPLRKRIGRKMDIKRKGTGGELLTRFCERCAHFS